MGCCFGNPRPISLLLTKYIKGCAGFVICLLLELGAALLVLLQEVADFHRAFSGLAVAFQGVCTCVCTSEHEFGMCFPWLNLWL